MSSSSPDLQSRDLPNGNKLSGQSSSDGGNGEMSPPRHADLSAWLIWAAFMLVAVSILPFAVRNQDVARAIARMCGFDLE